MGAELEPYSETKRDLVEKRLWADRQKRELTEDRRNGLIIRTYWLKLTNEISLQVIDEAQNYIYEQIVPNDSVLDATRHPFVYLNQEWRRPDEDGA